MASYGGHGEAEMSMNMPPKEAEVGESLKAGEYVPMFSAHSGNGEGYVMQNLVVGEGEEESNP